MVNKVEKRLQEVERKSKDGTTKTKSVTQKVDQQELKIKYVMKVSKEHTVRLNSQSEEIVKLGKSHEKLDTKVDSVKEDTALTNSKLDNIMKLLMNQNLQEKRNRREKVVNQMRGRRLMVICDSVGEYK